MIDLMMDLETLGKGYGNVVLSVAIVPFYINTIKAEPITAQPFLQRISIVDSLIEGYKVDGDTLQWWMQQDKEVREQEFNGTLTVEDFLDRLQVYFEYIVREHSTYRIWVTSAKLDFGCIQGLYHLQGRKYPIDFRSERCMRTFREFTKMMFPQYKQAKGSLDHNPISDCNRQIEDIQTAYRLFRDQQDRAKEGAILKLETMPIID